LHLRRIGTPLIIIVHPGTDAIADEAADRSACKTSRDALASPTAKLRTDQTAGNSADERAGIFLWSLASFGSAGARRHPQCDSRNSTQANERHVSSPQMIPCNLNGPAFPIWPRPTLQLMAKIGAKIEPACIFKVLPWQTTTRGSFDPQRFSGAVSTAHLRCRPAALPTVIEPKE